MYQNYYDIIFALYQPTDAGDTKCTSEGILSDKKRHTCTGSEPGFNTVLYLSSGLSGVSRWAHDVVSTWI